MQAAVAILHTIYAIYHLSRSSKGRTPASSASYMLFATLIDAGLIPFYVFTGLMARAELESEQTQGRWQSLFSDTTTTDRIIRATFLLGIVDGGLHFVSMVLSICLAVLFRKISQLPPDMNPLEDNLTARPKHKRNKSSMAESRVSQATTRVAHSQRGSKDVDEDTFRSIPFMHTRVDSTGNIGDIPHPKSNPRASQANMAQSYSDHPYSQRSSRITLNEDKPSSASLHRNSRTVFPNLMASNDLPHTTSLQSAAHPPKSPAPLNRSPTISSSVYSSDSTNDGEPDGASPIKRFTSTTTTSTTFKNDSNWITHPSPSPSPPRELNHLSTISKPRTGPTYQPLSQIAPFEYTSENDENLPPLAPLEMNPPTPPPGSWHQQQQQGGPGAIKSQAPAPWRTRNEARALTPSGANGAPRVAVKDFVGGRGSIWAGAGTLGVGKARAWGGMGGGGGGSERSVAGGQDTIRADHPRPRKTSSETPSAAGAKAETRGTRVISRSGVEVRAGGILPSGGVRAREVSGKAMEEGRGRGVGEWF